MAAAVERVLALPLWDSVPVEAIAVDDGSTDGSGEALDQIARERPCLRVIHHRRNRGKGAAIRTALENARGEFAVVQDSDLEYNPADLAALLRPLLEGHADAVFGSRFASAGERRVMYFWHSLANRLLTTFGNAVADLNLTDIETGYKAFRVALVRSIPLRSARFGIEPELTVKLAQRGAAIYEVPISYRGRTYDEGKKVGFRDALAAVGTILYFGFRRDIYLDRGARILDALAATPRFNRWMAESIRPYVGASVLEIGAGIGNMSKQLAPRRKSYTATDIDGEHLARLRQRLQSRPNLRSCKCNLAEPDDFAPIAGQADTVICLNVLEHIEDDAVGLRNMASALAPGGRAIVLVPQDQSIYGTLDEVLGHYRRYRRSDLERLADRVGLEIRKLHYMNTVGWFGWWVNAHVLRRQNQSDGQIAFFDRYLVPAMAAIEGAIRPPFGQSLLAVLRRPAA